MSPSPVAEAAAQSPNRPVPVAVDELHYLIRAQYKLLYVVSAEEERVERWLGELAALDSKPLRERWDVTAWQARQLSASMTASLPSSLTASGRDADSGRSTSAIASKGHIAEQDLLRAAAEVACVHQVEVTEKAVADEGDGEHEVRPVGRRLALERVDRIHDERGGGDDGDRGVC